MSSTRVTVSAILMIGNRTPLKSLYSAELLSGFSISKQSGKFAVFLKHRKNITARQKANIRLYNDVNSTSSLTCATSISTSLYLVRIV